MAFGPFGLLGVGARAAGLKVPGIGGVVGELVAPKDRKPDDPRNWSTYKPQNGNTSTPAVRSGRGSSSLSV